MLWSIKAKINGEDLELHIGTRELIEAEDAGIDVNDRNSLSKTKSILTLFKIAVKNKQFKDLDEVIDYVDNGETGYDVIANTMTSAMESGLKKNKK